MRVLKLALRVWFLCSLLVFPPLALNRAEDDLWYWAVRDATGELISFSSDGRTKVLTRLEHPSDWIAGQRLDAAMALLMLFPRASTHLRLFILTPNAAHPLDIDPEQLYLSSRQRFDFVAGNGFRFQRLDEGRLVLHLQRDSYLSFPLRLLIDLRTFRVVPLFEQDIKQWEEKRLAWVTSRLTVNEVGLHRFADHGKTLRYIEYSEDGVMLTLRERDMLTGQERTFHTTSDNDYAVIANQDGSRWLYYRRDWSDVLLVTVGQAAAAAPVAIQTDLNLCRPSASIYSDDILVHDGCDTLWESGGDTFVSSAYCRNDCVLRRFPDADLIDVLTDPAQPSVEYRMPATAVIDRHQAYRIDARRLLIFTTVGQYWILDAEKGPRLAGYLVWHVGRQLSPDRRWLVVNRRSEIDQDYALLDVEREELVLERRRGGGFVSIFYLETGIILNDDPRRASRSVLYRFEDGATLSLPPARYFAMLPDRSLLYESDGGIYRFDPERSLAVPILHEVSLIALSAPETGFVNTL